MRIDIHGDNYDLKDDVKKYVNKKLDKINRRMSRHQRESAHAQVILREEGKGRARKYTAEIILRLPPKEELVAKETTVNMFAAIDIVEAKIDGQIRKYKDKHSTKYKDRKGALARMRRLADRDFWGGQN